VEEAALQGIPTFAIDPKGDIGNLAFKSASFDFGKWSGKEVDALKIDRAKICRQPAKDIPRQGSRIQDGAKRSFKL
jgi:hypothetical protein